MWRYLAGAVAALLLAGAGMLLFRSTAREPILPAMPQALAQGEPGGTLPDSVPEASPKTREQRRFNRYDKDRDGRITRDEYLLSRRKAYAKLDTNGDGRLSFDEWAAKTSAKFASADADRSGAMDAREFATTAVRRKARSAAKCVCPPTAPANDAEE